MEFLKQFGHLINVYVHCIFLLTSSHIYRVEIHINSDGQLFQGYFSALEKDDIWSLFLAFDCFSLGSNPLHDLFSGYLYEAVPSCWIGTRVASTKQPSFPMPLGCLLKDSSDTFFSTITSFHHFVFSIGHWWTFSFLHLMMSCVIMFFLVLKQPPRGTLVLSDSRSSPRSFLDLRLEQRSYSLFSQGIQAATWQRLCHITRSHNTKQLKIQNTE